MPRSSFLSTTSGAPLPSDPYTLSGRDNCEYAAGEATVHNDVCWRLTRYPDQNHNGIPDPAVTGLVPTGGPAGTSVTISGRSFAEHTNPCFATVGAATEVKFGSTPATSFTVNSDDSITAVARRHRHR